MKKVIVCVAFALLFVASVAAKPVCSFIEMNAQRKPFTFVAKTQAFDFDVKSAIVLTKNEANSIHGGTCVDYCNEMHNVIYTEELEARVNSETPLLSSLERLWEELFGDDSSYSSAFYPDRDYV